MNDVISIITNLLVAAIGIYGLRAWKKTLSKQREIHLAEETLDTLFEINIAFFLMRNDVAQTGETDKIIEINYEYLKSFKKLQFLEEKVKLLYGNKYNLRYEELNYYREEVIKAAYRLPVLLKKHNINPDLSEKELSTFNENFDKLRLILYSNTYDSNDDEFGKKITDTINQVKESIKPLLKI